MKTNGKTGQLKGPFEANENLIEKLSSQMNLIPLEIFKIGIVSTPGHLIDINNSVFEIGKTGVLEIRDTDIKRLIFMQDENEQSCIDYMYLGKIDF